eukprot:3376307-Pyramimonas_sp.AAC.1
MLARLPRLVQVRAHGDVLRGHHPANGRHARRHRGRAALQRRDEAGLVRDRAGPRGQALPRHRHHAPRGALRWPRRGAPTPPIIMNTCKPYLVTDTVHLGEPCAGRGEVLIVPAFASSPPAPV